MTLSLFVCSTYEFKPGDQIESAIVQKYILNTALVLSSMLTGNTVSACTFCMATLNGTTLFGSNEDNEKADTNIWFLPPEEGKYGRVYFGYQAGKQDSQNQAQETDCLHR